MPLSVLERTKREREKREEGREGEGSSAEWRQSCWLAGQFFTSLARQLSDTCSFYRPVDAARCRQQLTDFEYKRAHIIKSASAHRVLCSALQRTKLSAAPLAPLASKCLEFRARRRLGHRGRQMTDASYDLHKCD